MCGITEIGNNVYCIRHPNRPTPTLSLHYFHVIWWLSVNLRYLNQTRDLHNNIAIDWVKTNIIIAITLCLSIVIKYKTRFFKNFYFPFSFLMLSHLRHVLYFRLKCVNWSCCSLSFVDNGLCVLSWFEIINVIVSSFRFIWIPMLWVHDHCNYVPLSVWGSTSYVRIWRLKGLRQLTVSGEKISPINKSG